MPQVGGLRTLRPEIRTSEIALEADIGGVASDGYPTMIAQILFLWLPFRGQRLGLREFGGWRFASDSSRCLCCEIRS
jgi:hypothetical protein